MITLPLAYTVRHLRQRWLTTLLTVGGIALAAFALAALLMVRAGLQQALVESGSPDNAIVVARAVTSETRSTLARADAAAVEMLPGIARDARGERLAARELALPIPLPGASPGDARRGLPVTLRGTSATGLLLRDHARLAEGRFLRAASAEIVLGAKVHETLPVPLGSFVDIGPERWRVVGVFGSSNTALDNEIWADVDTVMQAFQRSDYSSVLARIDGASGYVRFSEAVATKLRGVLSVAVERRFYAEQAALLARFLRSFALLMGAVLAVGAVAGAMTTMHAAVAYRTQEIGTLRALGFPPASVLAALLLEAALIGTLGGMIGVAAASQLTGFSISTLNVGTSTGITFALLLTPSIALAATVFALALGTVGGLAPVWRPTQLRITDALRETG